MGLQINFYFSSYSLHYYCYSAHQSQYKVSHFNDNNHEVFVVHVAADEVLEIFKD